MGCGNAVAMGGRVPGVEDAAAGAACVEISGWEGVGVAGAGNNAALFAAGSSFSICLERTRLSSAGPVQESTILPCASIKTLVGNLLAV